MTPPLPPPEMRALVGPIDEASFDNPTGAPIWTDLGDRVSGTVFDFGSGCGRLARRLMQQHRPPEAYLGVDLHRGMVQWCRQHLASENGAFRFEHHDVYEPGFNPLGRPATELQDLPAPDGWASLVIAWSVFTHLVEDQTPHYLAECARILRSDGIARSTWFLFDKRYFPMMQTFQNTLYINPVSPTNAVIYDRQWLLGQLSAVGLTIERAIPPTVRGFQWTLDLRHAVGGEQPDLVETDDAPFGRMAPPIPGADQATIGLDG